MLFACETSTKDPNLPLPNCNSPETIIGLIAETLFVIDPTHR